MRDFILKTFTDDEAETCLRCNMQELIRCEDCQYYEPQFPLCKIYGVKGADWFCADGERKKSEGEV